MILPEKLAFLLRHFKVFQKIVGTVIVKRLKSLSNVLEAAVAEVRWPVYSMFSLCYLDIYNTRISTLPVILVSKMNRHVAVIMMNYSVFTFPSY